MAQPLRIQVPGAWFHVTALGNERRDRSSYTGWFNRRHRRAEYLVQGRFQSVALEGAAPAAVTPAGPTVS